MTENGSYTKRRKVERQAKRKRHANRKLLREARRISGLTAEQLELGNIDPIDAIQQALDRTYALLVVASREVDNLPADQLWRNTKTVGRIPHEWIRLEQELREEVGLIAAKMLDLDIESRKVDAAELMAGALAPVLKGILADLNLTAKQEKKAPRIVKQHLRVLEAPQSPLASDDEQ